MTKGPYFTPVLLDQGTAKPGVKAPPPLFFREGGQNRREDEGYISKHTRINSTFIYSPFLVWCHLTDSPPDCELPAGGDSVLSCLRSQDCALAPTGAQKTFAGRKWSAGALLLAAPGYSGNCSLHRALRPARAASAPGRGLRRHPGYPQTAASSLAAVSGRDRRAHRVALWEMSGREAERAGRVDPSLPHRGAWAVRAALGCWSVPGVDPERPPSALPEATELGLAGGGTQGGTAAGARRPQHGPAQ